MSDPKDFQSNKLINKKNNEHPNQSETNGKQEATHPQRDPQGIDIPSSNNKKNVFSLNLNLAESSSDSSASPPSPSDHSPTSSNASTPIIEKLPLRTTTPSADSTSNLSLSSSPSKTRPPYIRASETSPASSFTRIPGSNLTDPPISMWKAPDRMGKTPRAATFFLGKDYERWQRHDRDNMGLNNKLAWNKGTSSSVFPMVRSEGDLEDFYSQSDSEGSVGSGSESSEDGFNDNDQAIDSDYASEEEIPIRRFKQVSTTSNPSSKELFGSIGEKEKARERLPSLGMSDLDSPIATPGSSRARSRRSSKAGQRSRRESQASNASSRMSKKERRFSTNGPEAAIHRHETVIGIHTPRRDSTSSARSSGSGAGSVRMTPLMGMGLAPLSQIPAFQPQPTSKPPSGSSSLISQSKSATSIPDASTTSPADKDLPVEIDYDEEEELERAASRSRKEEVYSSGGKVRSGKGLLQQQLPSSQSTRSSSPESNSSRRRPQKRSSSVVLAEAAAKAAKAAAAGQMPVSPPSENRESFGVDPNGDSLAAAISSGSLSSINKSNSTTNLKAPASPTSRLFNPRIESPALKLARRRRPVKVDGTLYDRSGPFKEGNVTDGLSVRLFTTGPTGNAESQPTTYLITTPDNRVASAAKLRRWAMDGCGRFYAAMEIKSIEAKLKNADPTVTLGSGLPGGAKELMKELKSTYLEDLLDEVQKAETLNPSRKGAVAHVLKTEDGKFIRLEEDYPEEAFFVVAGCEEEELAPVVKLIFTMAIRALNKFHSAGWMHGDIKLENLMFDQSGDLVVIDYENANPYRSQDQPHRHHQQTNGGDPNQDPDGYVQLVSYDWASPEAQVGPFGRRMGPSGDLWALGCNLIRAFALRDGVEDNLIRESLLGTGQEAFLKFRDSATKAPRSGFPRSEDVDLSLILGLEERSKDEYNEFRTAANDNGLNGKIPHQDNTPTEDHFKNLESQDHEEDGLGLELDPVTPLASNLSHQTTPSLSDSNPNSSSSSSPSQSGHSSSSSLKSLGSVQTTPNLPTPSRILQRFATQAPELLQYVLARCVTSRVIERSLSSGAEIEGLKLADKMDVEERRELEIGRRAVDKAIDLSGSSWVRPKLDEARASLGLD